MAGENTNVEPPNGNENPLNYEAPHMASEWQIYENNLSTTSIATIPPCNPMVENSFCSPIWEQPINHQNRAYCDVNFPSAEMLKGSMLLPSVSGMDPQNLSHLPVDSGFIERAARFSCFGGGNLVEMMNPFSIPDSVGLIQGKKGLLRGKSEAARKEAFENEKKSGNSNAESNEAEFSGGYVQEGSSSKGPGSKKRKRGTKGENEHNEDIEGPLESIEKAVEAIEIRKNSDIKGTSINRNGGKSGTALSQGTDQPKEEYIHIRARRGQATNSHSLAERVRREKISERMKLLQDLVPGCSKVTGKAVMLDEIINYVQSLQRQVEFLSMKLATVNPRLDFINEGFLAKDMLQNRGDMMPSLTFPSEMGIMPFPPPLHTSPMQRENIRRPIISHHSAATSSQQAASVWEDELHNVIHMVGLSRGSQDLCGSLPPPHMKAEP